MPRDFLAEAVINSRFSVIQTQTAALIILLNLPILPQPPLLVFLHQVRRRCFRAVILMAAALIPFSGARAPEPDFRDITSRGTAVYIINHLPILSGKALCLKALTVTPYRQEM